MSKLTERAAELEKSSERKDLNNNLKYIYQENALNYYEMAIEEKSCPYDVRSDMGRILNKQNKFEKAEKCFDIVLAMDQQHVESWFGLGISNMGQGKWLDALKSFQKGLNIDNTNANLWYYAAIILKEFNNEDAEKYYDIFKKLDNSEFISIRKKYKFFKDETCPIAFRNSEMKLKNEKKCYNIEGFKKLLSNYKINDDKITLILRTFSLKEFNEKILQLNEEKNEYLDKNIIYSEFSKLGLDKNDIDDMIQVDGIENVKKEVLLRCDENPFHINSEPPEIQPYVDSNIITPSKSVSKHKSEDQIKFTPIEFASEYNLFNYKLLIPLLEKKRFITKFYNLKDKIYNDKIHKANLRRFHSGIEQLNNRNIKVAIFYFNCIAKNDYNLKNDPELYINANFFVGSLLAKYNKDFNLAFKYFDLIEKNFESLKYNPIYLFNKGNLLYDLGLFKDAIDCYAFLNFSFAKELQGCAYYKLEDYENAAKLIKEVK